MFQVNSRIQNQLERALFDVEKVAGYDDKANPCFNIIDKRFGNAISKVSDRYELVRNKDLVEPFVNKFGLPEKVIEYSNRKSYIFEFNTGRDFDLGDGDIIKERIIIANSYDKTKSFSFFFGAFRMVCTNGLYTTMGAVLSFRKKHVGNIPVNSLVQGAIDQHTNNDFGFWKRLKQTPLTLVQEQELIAGWQPFEFEKENPTDFNAVEYKNNSIKRRALQRIAGDETLNNQRNGWGLFNQMNYAIAREYYSPAMVTKRISGDRRSEKFLAEKLGV